MWKKGQALLCLLALCGVIAAGSEAAVKHAAKPGTTASKVRVPNLRGKKLPLAEALLRMSGLRVGTEDCDCTFGVVVKSNWYVCMQKPAAGQMVARGTSVWTYSARNTSEC